MIMINKDDPSDSGGALSYLRTRKLIVVEACTRKRPKLEKAHARGVGGKESYCPVETLLR